MFVVGVQFTSTGSKGSSHPDNLAQAFRSTQKRLQQSESQKVEHGVKFLPRKSIVKSLPGKKLYGFIMSNISTNKSSLILELKFNLLVLTINHICVEIF